jgi:hypothetical protein
MSRDKSRLGFWISLLTFLLLFGLMAVGGIIGIIMLIKYFLGWIG